MTFGTPKPFSLEKLTAFMLQELYCPKCMDLVIILSYLIILVNSVDELVTTAVKSLKSATGLIDPKAKL